MLAGIVIDDGLVELEQLVIELIPELAESGFSETTIRTVLDITAAVAYAEDYDDFNADFWQETAMFGWRPIADSQSAPSTFLQYTASLQQMVQDEGQAFHYRTVLTNVLGLALERAAGCKLQQLLQERLWSRIGARQDLLIVVDAAGFPYVGAGTNACARDLAPLGQLVVQNGAVNNQQLVPSSWIDDTRFANERARELFAASELGPAVPGGHYRIQFWVSESGERNMTCDRNLWSGETHESVYGDCHCETFNTASARQSEHFF